MFFGSQSLKNRSQNYFLFTVTTVTTLQSVLFVLFLQRSVSFLRITNFKNGIETLRYLCEQLRDYTQVCVEESTAVFFNTYTETQKCYVNVTRMKVTVTYVLTHSITMASLCRISECPITLIYRMYVHNGSFD